MGIRRWLRELTASQNEIDVLRAIGDATGSAIRDLEDGVVARIIGVVEPLDDQRVSAPLSGRTVLGWGIRLDSAELLGWEREILPFAIADGGHRALIDAEHAKLLISSSEFAKCRGVAGAPDRLARWLREFGAVRKDKVVYRFSEWVIEPGMTLAVVGGGVREPDLLAAPTGYRDGRTSWIRIGGTPERPLAITDEV